MSLLTRAIALGILCPGFVCAGEPEPPPAPAAPVAIHGLGPANVLVIYDSHKADSVAIAAHYAGSDAVPNAPGQAPGTRKGVHVFDIGAGAEKPLPDGTVDYDQFEKLIRQPLIEHLSKAEYAQDIRVLVLIKGVPHRIADINAVATGDQPQLQAAAFEKGNATCASVDSELTLLWQDLRAGEKGGKGDSHADGLILNPFWRSLAPITRYSNRSVRAPKEFIAVSPGQFWRTDAPSSDPSVKNPGVLSPGDMYLVCRLDGYSVSEVNAALDRAATFTINANTACIILDECDSNGIADKQPNRELDNIGPECVWGGDDFEVSRDILLQDGRIRKDNIFYDQKGGADNFCIGPRLNCKGKGKFVGGPVLLLATAGGNATGPKLMGPDGRDVSETYPTSFQYAPGAVFTSIESFNGRDFGGAGGWPGQAQAATFIKAGGTFAICNAWEPFAFSLPDNMMLVSNFLLGNLTWAEAAYSSIPGISWQQVVIGDPLARAKRQCEDLNGDGVVDAKDLALFDGIAANKAEDGKPIDPMMVTRADINRDGKVDKTDRVFIERDIAATAFYAVKEPDRAPVKDKP